MKDNNANKLGSDRVGSLMVNFAIPSIIAMLVSALYNIVDQFFIGQAVGPLGNAATNIAFPLSMLCTALSLTFGIGGASCFNLAMGRGDTDKAGYYIGNSVTMLVSCGVVISVIAELFLPLLLVMFGSPDDVFPYAMTYVRITAIGFPFLLMTTGGGHLIRADGSPRMSMMCNMSGAIINTALDALFVLVFGWGMTGAAVATITGQFVSGIIAILYMRNYKTVKLTKNMFIPRAVHLIQITKLGIASCFNQLSLMIVQISLNNSLKFYGAESTYGESIPIACAGIIMKVGMLFFSVVIGIAQGSQPIVSFNYGARQYDRVRRAYKLAVISSGIISIAAFATFQLIPELIISLFGLNGKEALEFGAKFFRIFMFFTCINFLQPISATFFTSIGKAYKGMFLSLTRQFLFLLPLIFILPPFYGIDGLLFAAPTADFMAFIVTILMVVLEFRGMKKLESA